jgi:hypothetical protein
MEVKQFVAIQECSAGNESVGNMWLSTATFAPDATLREVYDWAQKNSRSGKLIIRHDESQTDDSMKF